MWKLPCRRLVIVTFACGLAGVVDVNSADAQGLFRRLQNRVQSRVESLAPTAPPAQSARPDAGGPAAQRLSPIDPNQPQGSGTSRGTSGSAPQPGSRFGGSILSRAIGEKPAESKVQPNAASKPSMGIQVVAATEGTPGLKVAGIRPGSRAGEAGLQKDDLIVAIDGTATPTIEAVADILRQRKVGDTLRATVVRGETAAAVMIPLLDSAQLAEAAARSNADSAVAGAAEPLRRPATRGAGGPVAVDGAVSPIDFGAAVEGSPGKRGVVISSVLPGSSAAAAGLRVGDRIVSVNGRLMLDEPTFQREFTRHAPGDELSINAVRDETLTTYDVVLRSRSAAGTDAVAQNDAQAPNAQAPNAEAPGSSEPDSSGQGGSVLGGLGSVLGGLFKGSADAKSAAASVKDAEEDTMDLGDGESIQRVGFEEEIKSDVKPLQTDPPSVEELTPPVAQPMPNPLVPSGSETSDATGDSKAGDEKDQIIQALRDEISRLQQRLIELEKDRP